jgi:hypothetical protein
LSGQEFRGRLCCSKFLLLLPRTNCGHGGFCCKTWKSGIPHGANPVEGVSLLNQIVDTVVDMSSNCTDCFVREIFGIVKLVVVGKVVRVFWEGVFLIESVRMHFNAGESDFLLPRGFGYPSKSDE